jgi:endoglucanase
MIQMPTRTFGGNTATDGLCRLTVNRVSEYLFLFLLLTLPSVAAADAAGSLLSNGAFTLDSKGANWPDDWPRPEGSTWGKEDDVRFIRLQSPKPRQMVMMYRQVILPSPLPPALEISLRVRYTDIKSGEQKWNDARVMGHFKNKAGKVLKPEPETPSFLGSTKEWVDRTYIVKVPAHSHMLELMPCLFNAESGTFDLALLQVFPAGIEKLPKLITVPSTTITPANPASLPPELRVVGNHLETKAGKAVWLQGLCVDSLEWSAGGEKIEKSIPVAIDQWKANVIRLPVKENFWAGRGPWQGKDGGMAYRKIVDDAVEAAASRGAYLALDLHQFGAPMPEHVEFWKDAATRYKNHPAVLFELFNEPHGITWKMWRGGGDLMDPKSKNKDVNAAENSMEATGEISPGMQALVDAVRSTGARNVIIAGGLDWGYDLSGVVKDYALQERSGGNGIVYSSHIYPWKNDWQNKVLTAAARYPLFIGEVGCPGDWKAFSFIPKSQHLDAQGSAAWSQDVVALIQTNRLNWTGFSFHPTCAPTVISDWQYTPTPRWGAYVKDALSGKTFELKKMR